MLKPWEVLAERELYRFGTTVVNEEICRHPDKGIEAPFFRMFFLDWVNVVPVTPDGQVVLVRQFRKGIHDFSLETPGGVLDAGETDPSAAGRRELEEETGYCCGDLVNLGSVVANPALQNNRCHFYLAENVQPTGRQHFDTWEDIELTMVPWQSIPEWVAEGKIVHSLAVLALMRAVEYLKTNHHPVDK